jgi:predicted lipoprotein with Yx(FWY)xxD motif
MKKLCAALATASVLAMAGPALAADPMQLTNQQMDGVTAGGIGGALINLTALANGTSAAATESQVTFATAIQTPLPAPLPSVLTVQVLGFNAAAN